jgi:alpha-1,2-mannosyltransferase
MNTAPAQSNRSDPHVRAGSALARPGLPALPGRPASLAARCLVVAVNLASVAFFLLSYSRHGVGFGPYRIDLDVYRLGSRAWLGDANLYGALPPTSSGARLPFSYPPIAAVLLSPLSLVPMAVAATALTLVTVALMALVLRMFLRSLAGPAAGSWWTIGWLLPAALFLEPVRNTLNYGQINVALMALVAADCLTAAPRWPRGALVGLAAAVKLTPAAFVLFFLLRRDWPAVRAATVSFAVSTGAGFLFDWHDSARYWTSVVFQAGRPGSPAYAANQSIQGVLARAGLDPHSPAGSAAWLALSAVVVIAACRGMRQALGRGTNAWALSLNALAALLVSPISWSHHWVWGETAMLTLALLSARRRRLGGLALAAVGLAAFAAAPQWWFPSGGNRELGWAVWQQAVGSSYVILAAAVLVLSAVRPTLARPPGERQPGAGLLVGRGVHGEPRLRQHRDLELGGGERDRARLRVDERADARLRAGHLVPGPQAGELQAQAGEPADVLLPVRVADVPGVDGPQPRHQVRNLLLVLGELLPGARLGHAAPQRVLVDARHLVPLPEQVF